jgi:hypothetical protein
MNRSASITISVAFALLFLFFSCKSAGSSRKEEKQEDCLETIKYYSEFWIRDSLGKNGFRQLYGTSILKKCNLEGKKWSEISVYFGKPNKQYTNWDRNRYLFRLDHYAEDMFIPGTLLLDVDTRKDTIRSFQVRHFHD